MKLKSIDLNSLKRSSDGAFSLFYAFYINFSTFYKKNRWTTYVIHLFAVEPFIFDLRHFYFLGLVLVPLGLVFSSCPASGSFLRDVDLSK